MQNDKFRGVSCNKGNPRWDECTTRPGKLYYREDIRGPFLRDYNRILHCKAYRRLKHKTQVFFATENDHICTRIEHVNHVSSVSYTISKFLGLNTELANAIAIGHDLGHAPFGHEGEKVLKDIAKKDLGEEFWHEKNSLRFIDKLETLTSPEGREENLSLTYAVRDGIVCHCGEVDENSIYPRKEYINLSDISEPGEVSPYTWEGCVVRIADKISYLGRDIEDALTLQILNISQIRELKDIIRKDIIKEEFNISEINNTALMHEFIMDLCTQSNPDSGLIFSSEYLEFINRVKDFNYKNIYHHPRLESFRKYARLIIESIYVKLDDQYDGRETLSHLTRQERVYPELFGSFGQWLVKYSDISPAKRPVKYQNHIVYNIDDREDYRRAIMDFISGMTDNYAIKIFNEMIRFM